MAGFNASATGTGIAFELDLPGVAPVGDPTKGNFIQASIPYANSLSGTGPSNGGVATPAWPGPAVAGVGDAVAEFNPSIPQPVIKLLDDPAVARSAYPPQVNVGRSGRFAPAGSAGVGTATTTSSAAFTTSSAVVSHESPLGSSKATSGTSQLLGHHASKAPTVPLLDIGSATTQTSAHLAASSVTTNAESRIGTVTVAGVVQIQGIKSSVSTLSDGKTATQTHSLHVGAVTVAGVAASIGPKGITLNKKQAPGSAALVSAARHALAALKQAHIVIRTFVPAAKAHGPTATASSGGVLIQFADANLPDLSKAAPQAPLPNSVGINVSLGLSQASATATREPALPPLPAGGLPATSTHTNVPAPNTPAGVAGPGNPAAPGGPSLPKSDVPAGTGSAPNTGNAPVVASRPAAAIFGIPVRLAWVLFASMLALMGAGALLSYANWQLLRGRTS